MRRLCCWLSALGAVMLTLLCVLGAVALPATRTELFERALLDTVNRQALGVREDELRAFAANTMSYLTGREAAWEPKLALYGVDAERAIPRAFREHMATVRRWVLTLPGVAIAVGVVAINLWAVGLFLRRFSRRWALGGVAFVAAFVALALAWAVADFDSLWMALHQVLIPDGIFPAREPVMQLFPLQLFYAYVPRVACALAGLLAGLIVLIMGLYAIQNRHKGTSPRASR